MASDAQDQTIRLVQSGSAREAYWGYPELKPCAPTWSLYGIVEGDHQPVWTKARSRYQVFGKWCENLWKQRKLSHERYEEYLFFTRDGVVSRKRNLDVVKEREQYDDECVERSEAIKRVKPRFGEFPPIPEAVAWLQLFKEELDRYPFGLGAFSLTQDRVGQVSLQVTSATRRWHLGAFPRWHPQLRP